VRTDLKKSADIDFDHAAMAYKADPSEANRLAYLAATNALQAAVVRAIETAPPVPRISRDEFVTRYWCR